MLFDLLAGLVCQEHSEFLYEIIVVDNDSAGSAREIVNLFKTSNPDLALHYAIEPQSGISHARNRTVAMSQGEFLAFIDDDESVPPNWLTNLLHCMVHSKADAVFGPVLPIFPPLSKNWAISGRFFESSRFADLTRIHSDHSRTGNSMVRAIWARTRICAPFDVRLANSGGEDYDFFAWVESNQGILVWSEHAVVSEFVPLERQEVGFLLKRSYRTSIVYWRRQNAKRAAYLAIVEAIRGLGGGTICMLFGVLLLPTGLANSIRLWCRGMNGFGRVMALTNVHPIAYGSTV
jgi:glycosyltransferase involved in cell wall biosynthesis